MLKTLSNGLKLWIGADGAERLVIDSSRLKQCIKYIHESNTKNITINGAWGFAGTDINFLHELATELRGLHILEDRVNYDVINSLHELRFLGFSDNSRDTIDLSNFPKIETLAADHSSRLQGLVNANSLKSLSLTKYNPKAKNVTELSNLTKLKDINLFITNIISLDGIQNFTALNKIHIYRAPKLEQAAALPKLKKLEEIEMESCKTFMDYSALSNVTSLKELKLFKCGDISSLSFIKSLNNLEFFSFWGTNVLDGNLTWLEDIKDDHYVSFDNKRHYNHKVEDFKKYNKRHLPKWQTSK